jgi:uncharacterized protein
MSIFRLFKPKEVFDKFSSINFDSLKSAGFKVILLDIDCTLIEYKSSFIYPENMVKLNQAIKKGFKVYAITNSKIHRKEVLSKLLGIPVLSNARKPFQSGFKRIQSELHCTKRDMVMIGDRITADILGGNIFGIHTIYVKAIDTNAPLYYRILLNFERFMYWLVK